MAGRACWGSSRARHVSAYAVKRARQPRRGRRCRLAESQGKQEGASRLLGLAGQVEQHRDLDGEACAGLVVAQVVDDRDRGGEFAHRRRQVHDVAERNPEKLVRAPLQVPQALLPREVQRVLRGGDRGVGIAGEIEETGGIEETPDPDFRELRAADPHQLVNQATKSRPRRELCASEAKLFVALQGDREHGVCAPAAKPTVRNAATLPRDGRDACRSLPGFVRG